MCEGGSISAFLCWLASIAGAQPIPMPHPTPVASEQPEAQTPKVEPERQPDNRAQPQEKAAPEPHRPAPAPTGAPSVSPSGDHGEGHSKASEGSENASESWTIFGTKFKVGESLLVVFTALLFFATLGLWLATRNLVQEAKRTGERQLRAYVHVIRVEVRHLAGMAEFFVEYKNHGMTPAYNVRVSNCHGLTPNPPDPAFFQAFLGFASHGTLGPGGVTHQRKLADRQLTDAESVGLEDGLLALWVYGEIKYRDAFGQERTTAYRNLLSRDVPLGADGRMSLAAEGNEAT